MSRRKQPPQAAAAVPQPCTQCTSLRAAYKAVRDAEKRLEAADPKCPCHGYKRSDCLAQRNVIWWTAERIAERNESADALESAREEFKRVLGELAP